MTNDSSNLENLDLKIQNATQLHQQNSVKNVPDKYTRNVTYLQAG